MPEPRRGCDIESFRGDWAQLAEMMQLSWAANKEQPLRYTEELLRSSFAYPGSSLDLAPSIYRDEKLVAFVAGFPRSVRLDGRDVRLLLNSFLTASMEVRKAGYGLMVWKNLIDRARTAGYEGTINFCVEGDEMNTMMPAIAKLLNLNTTRIYTVEYLTRFVRPSSASAPPVAFSADIDLFLELAAQLSDKTSLARTWTYAEAEWQCRGRHGAIAVSTVHGDRRGMLTGCIVQAGEQGTRVVLMEDLLWGNLEQAECAGLLRQFLQAAGSQGAQAASCPILGYASTDPLTAMGFNRSKRVLHAYLTLWNGLTPQPLPSLYIDAF